MNYHNITKDDMLNGEGLRVVLWVSGCSHYCKNCQNEETWDPNSGIPFDESAFNELINELSNEYIDGLTLSGGDPLYPGNRNRITELCKLVKKEFPDKTIWCYTGYEYEKISNLEVLNYIDVLVDGKFRENEKDLDLNWKGSANQRVIDLKESRFQKCIMLKGK